MKVRKNKQAFTIVELLVVIVVIGILAAITIVSYSGIQNKAIGANLKTDLASDAKQLKMYNVEYGHYPNSLDVNYCPATPEPDNRYCLKAMNGAKLSYVGGGQAFTLFDKHTATGITYKISEGSEPAISVLPGSFINSYGAGNAFDVGYAVGITSDDGYLVAGKRGGGLNMSGFTKFGPDNSISWSKYWDFTQNAYISAIKQTSDGSIVMAGYVPGGLGFGYNDSFIAKFSSTGQLSWMKLFGSSSTDYAHDLVQTSDGGYAIVGIFKNLNGISKFTKDGVLSWTKTYGGTTEGQSIVQASDGGFAVVAGCAILKTDPNGEFSWAKTWKNSSITTSGESGYGLVQTSDGGYAITGSLTVTPGSYSESFIIKLASDGSYQWHKYLKASSGLSLGSIVQTYDGDYVLAGGLADSSKTAVKGDTAISKISSSGTVRWSANYGLAADSEYAYDLALTSDGGYLIVGEDWVSNTGTAYKILVLKYKSDGTMNNCAYPLCNRNLVYAVADNITFTNLVVTVTSQPTTTVNKTYVIRDASYTQSVVAAP